VPRWEVACLNYQVRAELDSVVEHAVSQRMRPGTFLTKHSATPVKPFSSPSEALRKRTSAINGPRSNNGVRSCGHPSSIQFTAKFSGPPCPECTSSQSIDGSLAGLMPRVPLPGLGWPAGASGFCRLFRCRPIGASARRASDVWSVRASFLAMAEEVRRVANSEVRRLRPRSM
jgi:hypothetical protein